MVITRQCYPIEDVTSIGFLSIPMCLYFAWACKSGDWWTHEGRKRFFWAKRSENMYALFIGRLAIMVVIR